MSSRSFMFFGVRVVRPRGLRKSPGTNWFASCVAGELSGKRPGTKEAVQTSFRSAARACKSKGRSG